MADDVYDFILNKSIWCSVLAHAAADLNKKGYEGNISRSLFLTDYGVFRDHFELLCDLADIDPDYARRKIKELKYDGKKIKQFFKRQDKIILTQNNGLTKNIRNT